MSILLRGMKMPYSCVECLAVIRETLTDPIDRDSQKVTRIYNCCLKPDRIEDGWVAFSKASTSRQEWCPLVELPEKHGRLIDGDAVFDWYVKAFNIYPKIEPNEVRFSMNDIAGNLLNMPTIIEAEGEDG